MHIYSLLNKLLKSAEKVNAPTNTKEQIKNFQEEKQEKFSVDNNSKSNRPQYKSNDFNSEKNSFEKKDGAPKSPANTCYALYPKDGDTFIGMYNNEKRTFRLAGIDTPEKGSPWAKEASNFLRDKIGKKVVYLTFLGKDLYERDIVEVYLDKEKKQNVNKMLLQEGLASSERYSNNDGENTHNVVQYVKNEITEVSAKMQGKGMWGEPLDDEGDEFNSNSVNDFPEQPNEPKENSNTKVKRFPK